MPTRPNAKPTRAPLLDVKGLTVGFRSGREETIVVHDLSFQICEGETVALVGESGCGKSVTALTLARLLPEPPAFHPAGVVVFRGREVLQMSRAELRTIRGGQIAYVFQDPATALNPVFRIGFQLEEAICAHRRRVNARKEAVRLLSLVGLSDAEACLRCYPHELSGGMQQRVVIAMALACQPKLLVADEPTTALDVTIQAQILDLLKSLQAELGMAVLMITHNLGLVADVAHRLNVMYAGSLVESGLVEDVLTSPAHPYTRGLLDVVPRLGGTLERMEGIEGVVPSPGNRPAGCPFAPRCKHAGDACRRQMPSPQSTSGVGHQVCCYHPLEHAT
ncbi:MAG: ABC transporter ATP-binding protein [Verrucomicrobia bacterium]|jgi:peptide/nickel transport system ATP-binding protein|nr:ABC transporter ATP-binding protein [Verrucomicrobiota bacterium]